MHVRLALPLQSVHRTFAKTNPRHITSKRNFPARIHSGIHVRNHGIAASTLLKCSAVGAKHTPGTKIAKKLSYLDKRDKDRKKRSSSVTYKRSRVASRLALYKAYSRKAEKETYKKEMLASTMKSLKYEHTYATRSKDFDHSYSK